VLPDFKRDFVQSAVKSVKNRDYLTGNFFFSAVIVKPGKPVKFKGASDLFFIKKIRSQLLNYLSRIFNLFAVDNLPENRKGTLKKLAPIRFNSTLMHKRWSKCLGALT